MMREITVCFHHPLSGEVLMMELPRDTRFSALTDLLYRKNFLEPQKPGYGYLYQERLCGAEHTLGDYLPESAVTLDLNILQIPVIMV